MILQLGTSPSNNVLTSYNVWYDYAKRAHLKRSDREGLSYLIQNPSTDIVYVCCLCIVYVYCCYRPFPRFSYLSMHSVTS